MEFEAVLHRDRITGETIPGKVRIEDLSKVEESIRFIPSRSESKWKLKAGEEYDGKKLTASFADQWRVVYHIGDDEREWSPEHYVPTQATSKKDNKSKEMKLKIEVPKEYSSDLAERLRSTGFECWMEIKKSLGWPEVIYVAAASLAIIDILYSWINDAREKDPNITIVIITEGGSRINPDEMPLDEAKKCLNE